MWKPIRIHFERLISHLDSSYVFNQGETFIVTGRNNTDEGQGSNGGGKSTFIEAVAIAITGEPFRKLSLKEMITDGYNDCLIELELENEITEQMLYIKRVIHRNKSQKLQILLDGEDRDDKFGSDPREGNKLIEELIGIDKEDLLNYFIVSSEKYSSFFTSTDATKKKIINRFSNAEMINPVFDEIATEHRDLERQVLDWEKKVEKAFGSIETLTEQIDEAQGQIDSVNDNVKEYQEKIKQNEGHLRGAKELLQKLIDSKSEQQKEIETKKAEHTKQLAIEYELSEKTEGYEVEKGELEKDQRELDHFRAHIEAIIEGKIQCPSCGFEFALVDDSVDPTKAQEQLPDIKQELQTLEAQILKYGEKIEVNRKGLLAQKNVVRNAKMNVESAEEELDKIEKGIVFQQNNIAHYKKVIQQLNTNITELQNLDITNQVKALKVRIEKHQQEILQHKSQINTLEKEIGELMSVQDHFVRFKSFLANQSIESIEGFTNNYLQRIHTNLQVQINGYRVLADGKTLKEEIEVNVLRNGMVNGKFTKFSGGEKVRIDVCGILTLQKLINLNCDHGKGLDLLLIDEVIDSLDYEGISEVMHSLNDLNINVGIISHVKDGDFPNQLLVVKEKGISKIVI